MEKKEKHVRSSAFKRLLEQNPSLKIMLPLLGVLLVAGVIVLIISLPPGGNKTPAPGPSASPQVGDQGTSIEVLPQTERDDTVSPAKDPFTGVDGMMSLNGIVTSSDGFESAIISVGSSSYIVSADQEVGTTGWKIRDIGEGSVVLYQGDDQQTHELTSRN